MCESGGGRPGAPVPNSPYGPCGREATLNSSHRQELRNYVKVEMAVLGSPSLIVLACTPFVSCNNLCTSRLLRSTPFMSYDNLCTLRLFSCTTFISCTLNLCTFIHFWLYNIHEL